VQCGLSFYKVYLVIYRFTNNVLSTAQQVWLRKLGGAKPVVNENASGIITAGRAKRSASQPGQPGDRSVFFFEVPFIIPAARKGSHKQRWKSTGSSS
jgi:hypothetical protein